ncbi:hypothetical protein [Ornithinimicrobium kibberense]|uniref:hypothetical protein n=1 Tax=Ornithinimicrobium kibberense TaxID=282060 RepID=UPI00361EB800
MPLRKAARTGVGGGQVAVPPHLRRGILGLSSVRRTRGARVGPRGARAGRHSAPAHEESV